MTLTEIQKILSKKRRGTYMRITYEKTYGDYHKITNAIVRLINYSSLKSVQTQSNGEKKVNPNKQYLGNNLIHNTHTGTTCLEVFVTNGKYHKPRSVYEYMGEEITKEEFYNGTKQKPRQVSTLYTINIADIIAIA